MAKKEFYIGWQDDTPLGFAKTGRKFVVIAISIAMGFAYFFTQSERAFVDSYFDYGNLTELQGQLVLDPVPALIIYSDGKSETVPLVGFGKYGALPALKAFEQKTGRTLNEGDKVTLRGTIFTYQDKRWMELTEGNQSVIGVPETSSLNRSIQDLGMLTLEGEIIDPKCFFGVMNPADKAVHRSCAIRCISGGIPAILGIRENGVFTDYYFLLDATGAQVGNEILPLVGIPVSVQGVAESVDGWKTLKIMPEKTEIALALSKSAKVCL